MKSTEQRIVSYSRWIQYIHLFFPGLRIARSSEDICDCCVRIDIALLRHDLPQDERDRLLIEKRTHLDVAIEQRRFVSGFVKRYVAERAPTQSLPATIIPDHYDDDRDPLLGDVDIFSSATIQIQIEDFGGSFAMPHYGHQRPSADYFNSNLMISNFVIADLTLNVGDVVFYDERAQGKGADALCSLRFTYHINKFKAILQAGATPLSTLLVVLDNCVGQNKSQIVMQFFALLSLLFYKKVVLVYLIPGHSHNTADRIVAWCRNAMKGKNFYTPMRIVEAVNKVKGVNATFIDHRDAQRPCYSNWNRILDKNFIKMPSRYTYNYFFEIDDGLVSMRPSCSSPDSDSVHVPLITLQNIALIRGSILSDLFGSRVLTIEQALDLRLLLPTAPALSLSTKKLMSLGKKYFSIPPEDLSYYPEINASVRALIAAEEEGVAPPPTAKTRANKRQSDTIPDQVNKAKPGRPKAVKVVHAGPFQKSILHYFAQSQIF